MSRVDYMLQKVKSRHELTMNKHNNNGPTSMSRDEFIKSASRLGYCTKKEAEEYCNKFREDTYTEDDYIEVTRFVESHRYRSPGTPLAGGGYTSKRYSFEE